MRLVRLAVPGRPPAGHHRDAHAVGLQQRRSSWPLVRNWFLAMNFMAVIVFALLPTTPPRMIFTSGVADINYLFGARSQILENGVLANPFAAMPSLHFAYALFVAVVVCMLARQRWLRGLGLRLPGARASCRSSRPATTSSSTRSAARSWCSPPACSPSTCSRTRRRSRRPSPSASATADVANLKTRYTDGARRGFFKVGIVLARRGMSRPTCSPIVGLLLQVVAVPLILTGHFVWAAAIFGVAAICDALDGAVARAGAGATQGRRLPRLHHRPHLGAARVRRARRVHGAPGPLVESAARARGHGRGPAGLLHPRPRRVARRGLQGRPHVPARAHRRARRRLPLLRLAPGRRERAHHGCLGARDRSPPSPWCTAWSTCCASSAPRARRVPPEGPSLAFRGPRPGRPAGRPPCDILSRVVVRPAMAISRASPATHQGGRGAAALMEVDRSWAIQYALRSSASATAPRRSCRAWSSTRTRRRPTSCPASCIPWSAATTSATSSSWPPSTSTRTRWART